MPELVRVAKDGAVATATIDNPPVNALSLAVLEALERTVQGLSGDASVKAVVLTGTGKCFVAGADIRQLAELDGPGGLALAKRGQALMNAIELMDKPWIAALNGVALGGGFELAMGCHMRIADESVKIGQPESDLGIIPGFGGTQRLLRLANVAKAYELVLTGGRLTGKEAEAAGLVNRAVPDGTALAASLELAKKIASRGWPTILAGMQTVRKGWRHHLEEALAFEAEWFGKLCATDDKNEGMRAFLEKRPAQFRDR